MQKIVPIVATIAWLTHSLDRPEYHLMLLTNGVSVTPHCDCFQAVGLIGILYARSVWLLQNTNGIG